jgi:hypothetical protein
MPVIQNPIAQKNDGKAKHAQDEWIADVGASIGARYHDAGLFGAVADEERIDPGKASGNR